MVLAGYILGRVLALRLCQPRDRPRRPAAFERYEAASEGALLMIDPVRFKLPATDKLRSVGRTSATARSSRGSGSFLIEL